MIILNLPAWALGMSKVSSELSRDINVIAAGHVPTPNHMYLTSGICQNLPAFEPMQLKVSIPRSRDGIREESADAPGLYKFLEA